MQLIFNNFINRSIKKNTQNAKINIVWFIRNKSRERRPQTVRGNSALGGGQEQMNPKPRTECTAWMNLLFQGLWPLCKTTPINRRRTIAAAFYFRVETKRRVPWLAIWLPLNCTSIASVISVRNLYSLIYDWTNYEKEKREPVERNFLHFTAEGNWSELGWIHL